ncbi:MAG: hypothetical protein U1E73_08645 [Planctomycetota bacterium]
MGSRARRITGSSLVTAALAVALPGQCDTHWSPGDGVPGVGGTVKASCMWDPDGGGPATPRFVVGGSFMTAGDAAASNVAAFDPIAATWSGLGAGVWLDWYGGDVSALAAMPNGDLVVSGGFDTAGGIAASGIARWDGNAWHALGAGLDGSAYAMLPLPNGDLVVGGQFTQAGGAPANSVARWDGTSWHPLGAGLGGTNYFEQVNALAVLPNGDLVAAGSFNGSVAFWNGTTWTLVGGPAGYSSTTTCLEVMQNGTLVAGGPRVGVWTGSTWQWLANGISTTVLDLLQLPNGDLLAGTYGTLMRWNGAYWSTVASLDGNVTGLSLAANGDVFASGNFRHAVGVHAEGVARWDGTAWYALAAGVQETDDQVYAVAAFPDGRVAAAGRFQRIGGVAAARVAIFDGTNWQALGAGINDTASALAVMPNGDLVAAGAFLAAGGTTANHIARWNGTSWSPLGSGFTHSGSASGASVAALAVLPNGELLAGGYFDRAGGVAVQNLASWNGSTWAAVGNGIAVGGSISALLALPGGDLVVGGYFSSAGGVAANNIARWDGASWSPLGAGVGGYVTALVLLRDGSVAAGGGFTTAGGTAARYVARWDGAAWHALGSGLTASVAALTVLPDGDLAAGGSFYFLGGPRHGAIARWDGSSWSEVDGGLRGGFSGSTYLPSVSGMAMAATGELFVGGNFVAAGSHASAYQARLRTTCPALAAPLPTTCVGPAGPIALTADALPWTGGSFRSTATGFAANAFAASLIGLSSPRTFLGWLTPAALPGCDQLASHDAIQLLFPQAGRTGYAFAIPDSTAFTGVVLFHQILQFELGGGNQLVSLSASNGLSLTIGTF